MIINRIHSFLRQVHYHKNASWQFNSKHFLVMADLILHSTSCHSNYCFLYSLPTMPWTCYISLHIPCRLNKVSLHYPGRCCGRGRYRSPGVGAPHQRGSSYTKTEVKKLYSRRLFPVFWVNCWSVEVHPWPVACILHRLSSASLTWFPRPSKGYRQLGLQIH